MSVGALKIVQKYALQGPPGASNSGDCFDTEDKNEFIQSEYIRRSVSIGQTNQFTFSFINLAEELISFEELTSQAYPDCTKGTIHKLR